MRNCMWSGGRVTYLTSATGVATGAASPTFLHRLIERVQAVVCAVDVAHLWYYLFGTIEDRVPLCIYQLPWIGRR